MMPLRAGERRRGRVAGAHLLADVRPARDRSYTVQRRPRAFVPGGFRLACFATAGRSFPTRVYAVGNNILPVVCGKAGGAPCRGRTARMGGAARGGDRRGGGGECHRAPCVPRGVGAAALRLRRGRWCRLHVRCAPVGGPAPRRLPDRVARAAAPCPARTLTVSRPYGRGYQVPLTTPRTSLCILPQAYR